MRPAACEEHEGMNGPGGFGAGPGRALQGGAARTGVPLVPREGQNALAREPHPLALKHETLKLFMAHAVRTGTGATLSIHDAMPRNAAVIGKGMKGVADETGMPGKAREKGHLAVGSDTAAWDAPDDVVDRRVCGRYRRHRNWGALPNRGRQRRARRSSASPLHAGLGPPSGEGGVEALDALGYLR